LVIGHSSSGGPDLKGKLIVLSGPSGSGKSTLVARVLGMPDLNLRLSVSATTRGPRPGEQDGVHYHFWTRERFEQEVAAGRFLEWANVYGQWYGTLQSEVDPYLARGVSVLLEIDVQGARQVRRQRPHCVMVFVRTTTLEEYERRLRRRHSETEATLRRRLAAAQQELAAAPEYDYEIVNDNLDDAVQAFRRILLTCGGHTP
jgi:guanylate kinase